MTTLREAAQQALKALEQDNPAGRTATIAALRAALAEQDDDLTAAWMAGAVEERKRAEQAQPLTELPPLPAPVRKHDGQPLFGAGQMRDYARAVERAHGIKGGNDE